jgi:hypothetical protein
LRGTSELAHPPALSIRRPWTWLILHGGKNVENRTWTTTHRGLLLIHASGGWDARAIPFAGAVTTLGVQVPLHRLSGNRDLHPKGAIVGVVDLYDICTDGGACDCSPWAMPRQNHWRLRNPVVFPEPVRTHGYQKLWQTSGNIWPAVETQLKEVGRLA